jgi:uroporphyrinogen-III synthase
MPAPSDEATSHSTRLPDNVSQVTGYLLNSSPLAGERDAVSPCESIVASPLSGLKILVTRPREQAQHLADAIGQAGGDPVLFPLLEIAPVEDAVALQRQVAQLVQADLAIFISPNAVKYGMAAIREAGVVLPTGLKIATIGEGSAKALRDAGIIDVLAPAMRHDSEGLLEMLTDVAGWRILIFRGDGGRQLLGDTLKSRGAQVDYVTCYRRSKPELDAMPDVRPDAMLVTSSEALAYLWQIAPQALRSVPLFVPHPRIAELARSQGWAEVYLTDAGDEGILAALQDWARKHD